MTAGKALRPVLTGEAQNYKVMSITIFFTFCLDWGHDKKKSNPIGCSTCSPVKLPLFSSICVNILDIRMQNAGGNNLH